MTTYVEVAQALVSAGYLSQADIQAAAFALADALTIEAAEEVQGAATDDYSAQEDIITEVEKWEVEDTESGDVDALDDDEAIIEEAIEKELKDEDVVAAAEDVIEAAYVDAAAALLAAELIDEASLEDVAAVIADVWVVDED